MVPCRSKFSSENLSLNSVHGRTLFNSATDGGGSKQQRDFGCAEIRRQPMYTEVHRLTAINFGLNIFNTTGKIVNDATELVSITVATKNPTNLSTTKFEKHITKKP